MNLNTSINKEKAIKLVSIVVGLLITVILIWFALRYVQGGRAVDLVPSDIDYTSAITENSFVVKYETRCGLQPVVNYGSTATTLNYLVPPEDSQELGNERCSYAHKVGLLTESPQYFIIKIGEEEVTNAGVPFMVTLTGGGTVTPTVAELSPTAEASASPTVVATTPTVGPTEAGTLKPLSEVTDCNAELKDANGMLKEGRTARDWAECIKRNE